MRTLKLSPRSFRRALKAHEAIVAWLCAPRRDWVFMSVFWLVAIAILAWQCREVGNFVEDDALISLRYSERFLQGRGLTWNDGERVEGYSNLAEVLALAAIGATGLDLIGALRTFSFASAGLALLGLVLFTRRIGRDRGLTVALLASTVSLPVWVMGGLEQPLVLACLSFALWLVAEYEARGFAERRWLVYLAIVLVVLVLTRPDAPLFIVFFVLAPPLLAGKARWRQELPRALVLAGSVVAVGLAHLAFRFAYYGDWVPNTAHVKAHVSSQRFFEGLLYIRTGLLANPLLSGLAAAATLIGLARSRTRIWSALLLTTIGVWALYVAAIGGDHFPAWRHLLPVWTLAAAMVAVGFEALGTLPSGRLVATLVWLVTTTAIPRSIQTQWSYRENSIAKEARWQWEGQAVGELFGRTFSKEQPLYAVTAAGCLPYFSKLPALDMLGLNDRHIAKQPPDKTKPVGHDHGDGNYVLERAPDLITFNMPRGDWPSYVSGEQMRDDVRFTEGYRRVQFQALHPLAMTTETYVRLLGRVGIRTNPDGSIRLPTYLLNGATGHPLPDGAMGALLTENRTAKHTIDDLPVGDWSLRLIPSNSTVTMRAVSGGTTIEGNGVAAIRFAARGPVTIELQAGDLTTAVGTLELRRAPIDLNPRPELPNEVGQVTRSTSLDGWQASASGAEFQTSGQRKTGQSRIGGAPRVFFNSFLDGKQGLYGDAHTGLLRSASFVPTASSSLSFRVGGGRARGYGSQVGVRVVELGAAEPITIRFVASGEDDEVMRLNRLDLSWLAGRTLAVEVFDDAVGNWGHVLAGDFVLTN